MKLVGAILAGGRSSRMGEPKEGVRLRDGRSMLEHVAEALLPVCDEVVVVGSCRGFDPGRLGLKHIADLRSGLGPLAGIEAALRSATGEHYLFATCDQVRLTGELLRSLARPDWIVEAAALRSASGLELAPFPCRLAASLADKVSLALDDGERSPRAFLRRCELVWIDAPITAESDVMSVNTPAELESMKK